jgi:NAD(P)H-dependent FMN reductase
MKPILAFAGSNSPYSINQQLLRTALRQLPGAPVRLLSLADFPAPLYSECLEKQGQFPATIRQLHGLFGEASGFVLALPEHNGLPPAFFKNTLDWLSRIDQRIFRGKPVLLLSTSPGKNGGASSLAIMGELLPRWGGVVAACYSLPSFSHTYDAARQTITDPSEAEKLSHAVAQFSAAVLQESLPTVHA